MLTRPPLRERTPRTMATGSPGDTSARLRAPAPMCFQSRDRKGAIAGAFRAATVRERLPVIEPVISFQAALSCGMTVPLFLGRCTSPLAPLTASTFRNSIFVQLYLPCFHPLAVFLPRIAHTPMLLLNWE